MTTSSLVVLQFTQKRASSMVWPKVGAVPVLLALLISVRLSHQTTGDEQPSRFFNSEFIYLFSDLASLHLIPLH